MPALLAARHDRVTKVIHSYKIQVSIDYIKKFEDDIDLVRTNLMTKLLFHLYLFYTNITIIKGIIKWVIT